MKWKQFRVFQIFQRLRIGWQRFASNQHLWRYNLQTHESQKRQYILATDKEIVVNILFLSFKSCCLRIVCWTTLNTQSNLPNSNDNNTWVCGLQPLWYSSLKFEDSSFQKVAILRMTKSRYLYFNKQQQKQILWVVWCLA